MDTNGYLELRSQADRLFEEVRKQYPALVRCRLGCDDCCFAVFELTLVEAVHIARAFHEILPRKEKRRVFRLAAKAESQIRRIVSRARAQARSHHELLLEIGRARVECPLHVNHRCVLHEHRPITCRLYGIPTVVHGKGVTCGKSDFRPGESYPTADLDRFQQRMVVLSHQLVSKSGDQRLAARTYSMASALAFAADNRDFHLLASDGPNRPL